MVGRSTNRGSGGHRRRRHHRQPAARRRRLRLPHLAARGVPLHLDHLRHHRRAPLGRLPRLREAPRPDVDRRTPRRSAPTPGWSIPPRSSRCGSRRWSSGRSGSWPPSGSATVTSTSPVSDVESGAPKPPLWQIHPHDVSIHDGTYWVEDVPLPAGSIIHLRGKGPYWNGHGKGVISEHGAALGLAATVATYASGVFTSGIPAGYLKSNQPNMTADQAQTLKSTWLAQHGGTKRSIAVLNATTEFHPISISPGRRPARLDEGVVAARRGPRLRRPRLHAGGPRRLLHLRQRGVPHDRTAHLHPVALAAAHRVHPGRPVAQRAPR